MRFSKNESNFILAALRCLHADLDEPAALQQIREFRALPAAKIDRLCDKISSREKEIVYLAIHGGVAVFSATPGVALVHADFDSLEADPSTLPDLVIGQEKKREVVQQVNEALDRLKTLRPATASDKDIRRLERQLCRIVGVPGRVHQPKPLPTPRPVAEARPIRFTTLHNAARPVHAAQPLPA